MAERGAWERRVRVDAAAGLGGAGLVVLGSLLPWFGTDGRDVTGWDLADIQRDAGRNPFLVDEMFEPTFDPLLTGATTLALGVALAAIGVVVLTARRQPPPARFRVHPALYAVLAVTAVLTVSATTVNVVTVLQRPATAGVSVAAGFWLTVVSSAASTVMLLRAAGATRAELAAPPPGRAAAPAQPPPDWYPDPVRRHEIRYWDGAGWTTHVADAGTPGEDPVSVP